MEQGKEIKENWAGQKDVDIYLCGIFNCYGLESRLDTRFYLHSILRFS